MVKFKTEDFAARIKQLADKLPESWFPPKIVGYVPEGKRALLLMTLIAALALLNWCIFPIMLNGALEAAAKVTGAEEAFSLYFWKIAGIFWQVIWWILNIVSLLVSLFFAYYAILIVRKSTFDSTAVLFAVVAFVFSVIVLFTELKTLSDQMHENDEGGPSSERTMSTEW